MTKQQQQAAAFLKELFEEELSKTHHLLTSEDIKVTPAKLIHTLIALDAITELKRFAEQKCYKAYTADQHEYLQFSLKSHPKRQEHAPTVQQLLTEKFNLVQMQIPEDAPLNTPKIPASKYEIDEIIKQKQMKMIKEQTQQVRHKLEQLNKSIGEAPQSTVHEHNHGNTQKSSENNNNNNPENEASSNAQRFFEHDEKREKEIKEWLKKKQIEKEERRKKLEEQAKKEAELEKLKEEERIKKEKEEMEQKAQKLQERLRKEQEKREEDKKMRQRYQSEYLQLKAEKKVPLFQKLQNRYSEIVLKKEQELRKEELQKRRLKLNLAPLDSTMLNEHSQRYEQWKQENEEKRKERLRLMQSETHRPQYYSRYKEEPPEDKNEEVKQEIREKIERIRNYHSLVKEKYKPKVDEKKRRQLLNQIEELELGHKRLKKTKLENGSILYEEMPQVDPKVVGMEYLEYVKKIAEKQRGIRKKPQVGPPEPEPKNIDYLAELKKQNKKRLNLSQQIERETSSVNEKIKKVQMRVEMLDQEAKRKETLLKYGKFMTPEQILSCKEQLDDHYLQAINMKLKLINESK